MYAHLRDYSLARQEALVGRVCETNAKKDAEESA
jgi:hypothetical protein